MKASLAIVGLLVVLVLGASGAQARPEPGKGKTGPWRLVFRDDFSSSSSLNSWWLYEGQPGGDPGGWWDPSHVVVDGGLLHLKTYRDAGFGDRWVSGGLTNSRVLKQQYGKYLVRFRATVGYGVANIMLLWPVADHWPPEIDFAEDSGSSQTARPKMSSFLHYGSSNSQIQREVYGDFTQWHTMGVEWTPGQLVYTIDGKVWGTIKNKNVPKEKMELALQTQAGTCGDTPCPDSTTPSLVEMQVDWVEAYSYNR